MLPFEICRQMYKFDFIKIWLGTILVLVRLFLHEFLIRLEVWTTPNSFQQLFTMQNPKVMQYLSVHV